MNDDYQFDDAEDITASAAAPASHGRPRQEGGGGYAQELFSKRIDAKFRTFFIDLKESINGKFIKISEKSRGRKSTIMLDAEDVPAMIEALKEVQTKF